MRTSSQSNDLSRATTAAGESCVEIAAEPRSGAGPTLRNIVRQPWFTSLSLFLTDLLLVSGAYILSRAIRAMKNAAVPASDIWASEICPT